MHVLVCGGRDYLERSKVFEVLDNVLIEHEIELLVHGGWPGADALAGDWAMRRGVRQMICAADWARSDGSPRTATVRQMLDILQRSEDRMVVAFPGGWGTAIIVGGARAMGVSVLEVGQFDSAWRTPPAKAGRAIQARRLL